MVVVKKLHMVLETPRIQQLHPTVYAAHGVGAGLAAGCEVINKRLGYWTGFDRLKCYLTIIYKDKSHVIINLFCHSTTTTTSTT